MNNYTVYIHTNKINGLSYVGMTCQKPEKRWKSGNGYKNNKRFGSDIEKYGWDSFTHTIIASDLSEEEAQDLERMIVEKLNLKNSEKGYNKLKGGTKNGMKGKHQSENTKLKISKSKKEQGFTDEHRKHISESKKGIKHHLAKKVYQYSKDGKFIKEWQYMNEASKTLNICKTSISSCCLGKRPSAGGYIWSYERKE